MHDMEEQRKKAAKEVRFVAGPLLPLPENLGLSDFAKLYKLPPRPAGLTLDQFPPTLGAVRDLLPNDLMPIFDKALNEVPYREIDIVIEAWGAFALRLHNDNYQADLELIMNDRSDEIPTYKLPTLDPQLSDEEKGKLPQGRLFYDGKEITR